MDGCNNSPGEAKVFSMLDANSSYWKIQIVPEYPETKNFTGNFGTNALARTPFGLKNAPAAFQCTIERILTIVKMQFVFVHLDCIIEYLQTCDIHKVHVPKILTLLRDAEVIFSVIKSKLFHEKVDYLGNIIKPSVLEVAPTMI